MNAPNAFLCDVYGTSKTASAAGKLVAGFLTHRMMQGGEDRQAQLQAEAEMMNRISRILEEKKMRATLRGLSLGRGGASPDTDYDEFGPGPALFDRPLFDTPLLRSWPKHAEAAGRSLARQGMDKEAIGSIAAMLPGLAKFVSSGAAKLMGGARKAVGQVSGRLSGAAAKGGGAVGSGGTQVIQSQAKTQGMKAMGPGGTKIMSNVAKTQPMKAMGAGGTQVMEAAPEIAKKAPGMLSRAGSRVAEGARRTGSDIAEGARQAGSRVAEGARAVPGRLAEGAKSLGREAKHNLGFGFRAKAALGVSALGLGYMGLKGMQSTRDYMMQPSGGYGSHRPMGLRHNVSGFGGGYAY